MEEFLFLIEHRPGTRHGNADAMSRRPCPKKNCACTEGATSSDTTLISFRGPADRSPIVTRNSDVIPENDESIASSVSANHITTDNAMSRSTVISQGDTSIVNNVVYVNGVSSQTNQIPIQRFRALGTTLKSGQRNWSKSLVVSGRT